MSKIIFTGTGSGYPSKDRACSSFILNTGQGLYQFDAGEGFSGSALKLKIETNDIFKIFISHLHPDHITGLFLELQLMYLDKRRKALDIYLPEEAIDGVGRAAEMFYLLKEKFPFKFNLKPIKPNLVYRGKTVAVTAYLNKHLIGNETVIRKYHKRNRMQSYSYVIKVAGGKILYSGDISSVSDLAELMQDIDIAIVEGMHIDRKALFEMAANHKIKKLVLTHLPDKILEHSDRIAAIARKCNFKNLIFAEDGLTLKI